MHVSGISFSALVAHSPLFWMMWIFAFISITVGIISIAMGMKEIEKHINNSNTQENNKQVKNMLILGSVCFVASTIFLLLAFFVFK